MRRKSVDELEGNEILARHILTKSGFELMAVGTVIRKDYIKRLKELEYEFVYVRENEKEIDFEQPDYIVKEQVRQESIQEVKSVLEKHVYRNSTDIEKLCKAADNIIEEILNEDEIQNQIINIRRGGRDLYTHSINVCALSTVMGLKLGYDKKRVSDMAKGSLLHDIGLKYTTVRYQDREEDEMSINELKEYRKHVITGYNGIENVDTLPEIAKMIVLHHHERGDGSGYPQKHHYNELDEEIKIVSICDEFDSMITGMGRKIYKIYEAVEYMKVHSVDYFDDRLVNMLLQMVAVYPVATRVITSNGDVAVVVRQNEECPERPVIKLLADSEGSRITETKELDLLDELTVFIVDTYE